MPKSSEPGAGPPGPHRSLQEHQPKVNGSWDFPGRSSCNNCSSRTREVRLLNLGSFYSAVILRDHIRWEWKSLIASELARCASCEGSGAFAPPRPYMPFIFRQATPAATSLTSYLACLHVLAMSKGRGGGSNGLLRLQNQCELGGGSTERRFGAVSH